MFYRVFAAALAVTALSGCLAKAALDVATLPVKVASKTVDAVTTSQAEADQKRGREVRKREEKLGQLKREYDKQAKKCAAGDADACAKRERTKAEIDKLMPMVPAEIE
jgi:Skp family chaperone for outer membrane proteins